MGNPAESENPAPPKERRTIEDVRKQMDEGSKKIRAAQRSLDELARAFEKRAQGH